MLNLAANMLSLVLNMLSAIHILPGVSKCRAQNNKLRRKAMGHSIVAVFPLNIFIFKPNKAYNSLMRARVRNYVDEESNKHYCFY